MATLKGNRPEVLALSLQIDHVTGGALFRHREQLEEYLAEVLAPHLAGKSWMSSTKALAQRFRLPSLAEKTAAEPASHDWDTRSVDGVIRAAVTRAREHIPLPHLHVTVLPALPFRWFREYGLPASRWTNGFTNGPERLIIAVPPEPDPDYLANMVAHECHHASPENPIYNLALERFTLAEWIRMEGSAEYFSLQLFPDARWWWPSFPVEKERDYWALLRPHLESADDAVKGPLAFGSKDAGIPTFAGYTFGYRAVAHHLSRNPNLSLRSLFQVDPLALVEGYMAR